MKDNEMKKFKYNFLSLRWMIVIVAGYMAILSGSQDGFNIVNYVNGLVIFFILSNVILYFIPLEVFKNKYFRYFVFIADIILVSLAIYLTKNSNTDFFMLYFLVIIITTLGKDIKASIVATLVASLLYLWLLINKNAVVDVYDPNVYMRIPFLFVIGLFTGFLSETVKEEETHVKDLQLIMAITNVINENMNYKVMIKLLEPLFEKIITVSDWEIGIFNESTNKFNLLRQNSEIAASEMEPEIISLLLGNGQIYKSNEFIYFPQSREKKVTGFLRIKPKNFINFKEKNYDLFITLAGEFAIVTERNKLYEQLRKLANTDRLTELYNYGYFLEHAGQVSAEKKYFAVIIIDVDNFKSYNDTYGHLSGNMCLRSIADNMKKEMAACVLGRFGGDEFIVLREGKNEDIAVFLEKFKSSMNTKFHEYDKKAGISISIGYALYPKDGNTLQEVIAAADKALYKAKQTGKDKVSYL